MEITINRKRIYALLSDFHKITGLRVGVFDTDFREVVGYPVRLSEFCYLVRSCPEGQERCLSCDRAAFSKARALREAYVYRCHAGLTEAAAPILSGGETIGFLMFGQMRRCADAGAEWREMRPYLAALPGKPDRVELERAFRSLPTVELEKAIACAHVLQACAVSVWLEDCLLLREAALHTKAERYIQAHLNRELSLETIAAELCVGKTTLCACVKEHLGMTVGELVRIRRMEKARALLERTDQPVAAVAEQTGIPDYNYFTKVFRASVGMTPTAYRKLLRQSELSFE